MGKQAKIKRVRRIRKELDAILEEGLETGKIIQDRDRNIQFEDEMLAQQYFMRIMSSPEIFSEFIEDNPDFLRRIIEGVKAAYEEEYEEDEENEEDE